MVIFKYQYPQPKDEHRFPSIQNIAIAHWNKDTEVGQYWPSGQKIFNG
jgi:hypothetical protein